MSTIPMIMAVAVFAIVYKLDGSLNGLLLTYAFSLEEQVAATVYIMAQTESLMVSFERVHALLNIPEELGYNEPIEKSIPKGIPEGKLEIKNVDA